MPRYRVAVPPQIGQPEPQEVWWRVKRALTEQAARDMVLQQFQREFGYEADPATVKSESTSRNAVGRIGRSGSLTTYTQDVSRLLGEKGN